MKAKKIIFFGLGSAGQRHLRNLLRINSNFQFYYYKTKKENFVITDKNKKINISLEKKYSITYVKKLSDIKKIKPDIAFITNDSPNHLMFGLIAAKYGCDIFIEKPISNSLKKLDKFLNIIKKNKIVCQVGYQFTFHPFLKKLKQIILNKKYGNLKNGSLIFNEDPNQYKPYYSNLSDLGISSTKRGGGVLLEQSHFIHILIWLFEINPKILNVINKNDKKIKFDKNIEDQSYIKLLFKSKKFNSVFDISLSSEKKEKKTLLILNFERIQIQINLVKNIFISLKKKNKKIKERCNLIRNDLFMSQLKYFLKKINKRDLNKKSTLLAVMALKTILQLKKKRVQSV